MANKEKVEHLERKMEARHIQMISLGGVIGTGLYRGHPLLADLDHCPGQ